MNRLDGMARTMPLPLKRTLKAAASPLDRLYVAAWQRRHGDGQPLPPLSLRSRVGAGLSIPFYVSTGKDVSLKIEGAFRDAGRPLGPEQAVLDWGCGAGRVAAPLGRLQPEMQLHGCDVDAEAIEWARRNLPAIDFRINSFEPPLPYGDNSFDAVYSISILTHLTREMQHRWLKELHRVLRPGGLALLTTCGPTFLKTMQSRDVATNSARFMLRLREARLSDEGFAFVPYVRSRWNERDFSGIGAEYGLAFQTAAQVRAEWAPMFEVDHVRPGFINHGQDLVIASRQAEAT